ncbi:MAG: hypothetical protein QG552_794 [Thermodesulfobacteriota bacterium]|nr:hypothetical protein [Thermodesulfobacteriota bacterium]
MRKILVIDDEKPTLNMFRLFLGAYGYTVLTAENGAEGLEAFERERPSIVLTDLKMPGMDGLEVLRRLKGLDPSAEVIVITGHGDMDLAVEAMNLDATDFINKPIQKSALDHALKRAEERINSAHKDVAEVSLRSIDDVTVMDIKGQVDSSSEPMLLNAYEKAKGSGKIVILFDKNASINGAGIGILIQILSRTKERGQKVAIAGPSENYRRIFEMVGITASARTFAEEGEAVLSLADT